MAKKPSIEGGERDESKIKSQIKVETPIFFSLPYQNPFYILEIPNEKDLYYVFNTLEGAVKYLDGLADFDPKDTKLLSFNRANEQFSVSQISWADIYQISKAIRKKEG